MKEMQQKRSVRKRITDTTKDYSSSTTIHGFAYLSGDNITAVERLLWAIVVISAILFATYLVANVYKGWQDDPVITTLDTVALPIEEIEFPAVTICPQGSRQEIIDLVLYRQLTEYIENSTDNVTTLTAEEMMEKVISFLNDVYPGANGNPTMFTKLMTSDNPSMSMENDAILGLEEKCDPSSNNDMAESFNKKLNNDSCPIGFEMAKDSTSCCPIGFQMAERGDLCIHSASAPMTYTEATQYCYDHGGSNLYYPDTSEDLIASSRYLHFSGKIADFVRYQK